MSSVPTPVPVPDIESAPFWEACANHELRVQRCAGCGRWRHPPRPRCPACRSPEVSFEPVSGRGVVWSFTWCHPPVLPGFAERVPYNAIVVRLEEGVFVVSNLIECEDEDVRVDLPVEVVFTELEEGVALPHFRPLRS